MFQPWRRYINGDMVSNEKQPFGDGLMSCLHYQQNELRIENVPLKAAAEEFGTPCYLYSRAAIEKNWHAFDQAFHAIPHRVCYAVKANSNLAILAILARMQSGFDIVSGG